MKKIVSVYFDNVDEDIINTHRLFNVYLLGLPRSGTSLTTHILELLGVNMIYTSEEDKEKTDERFKNKYGEYHPNPDGFWEITKNQFTNFLRVFEQPYSGCKMIVPVNGIRWEMVRDYPCKVIFMTRDVEEIRQSQEAYYAQEGSVDVAYLRSALATQRVRLREHKVDFLEVNYNELLIKPREIITEIRDFIQSYVKVDEAVKLVNPDKNRFKREQLIAGL